MRCVWLVDWADAVGCLRAVICDQQQALDLIMAEPGLKALDQSGQALGLAGLGWEELAVLPGQGDHLIAFQAQGMSRCRQDEASKLLAQ
jgi:hypothetical protein